jgi:hypothetical protein
VNFKVKLYSICLCLLLLCFTEVQAAENGQALNFPASQNNVLPLPQKFEYSLRDAYRFLLGNRIIDTSNFQFLIRPLTNSVEVDMKWPENIFDSGTLSILSPSGISVWSVPLEEKQNSISIKDASSLVYKLLGLSFFKYCISRYELNTGMEVCSPELVAKGAGSKIRVESKSELANKSSISINGKPVTPHGIVFLNDEKESLSFRAKAASGAEFKMDTRSINLDFLDVISLSDTLMSITIKGPFPLAPAQYRIIKDNIWSVTLKKDRAQVYIAGAGKVPLRQEFVVQGNLPTEANRLYLEKSSPTRAYASSLELRGWTPEKGTPQAADDSSEVAVTENRFSWSLKNLTAAQDKVSNIQVVDGKDVFTASYYFSRAYANRFAFLGGIKSGNNTLYFGAEGQAWLESLPYLSRVSQQKVGIGVLYNQDFTGKIKTILTEVDGYWRLKRGLQFYDASFLIGLGIQNFTFDSQSLQTMAPFLGWMGPSFKKLKYFDWQEFYLKQSLTAKTSNIELKSRTEFKWKLFKSLNEQRKLRYTAGFYSEDAAKKSSGLVLEAAWVMTF